MLLLTLFAVSWGKVFSGILGFLFCAGVLFYVIRMKKSDGDLIGEAGEKAKSLAGDAADKAKSGAESLASGLSELAGDDPTEGIADAFEAATVETDLPNIEVPGLEVPDVELPDVELPDVEVPVVDLPEVELPEVELPDTFEMTDVESNIDDVLSGAQTFEIKDPAAASGGSIPEKTIPSPTLGASVPPPRSKSPVQSSFASSKPASTGSSIPPRRDKSTTQSPVVPEPGEIEVLDDSPHIASFQSGSTSSADKEELADLRLALEASHNELTHLTTQRDQALSRAVQHEEELSQLRHQVENLNATSEALQQDRQTISQLEAEVEALRSQVSSGLDDEAIHAIEAQHQATVEELRLVLGQREAAEASLSRERDNLTAQNEDLRRKVDQAEGESPQADNNEFTSLQMQHQQTASELSLSNETIRQLNQNLNQRDSQLMNLRNEVQSLTSKLAESEQASEEASSEPDTAVIEEIEAQHKATVDELRSIIEEREAAESKLASEREKLSAQVSEFREKAVQLEEELDATKQAAAEASAQESPDHSLANETVRQLNQNLTQRDAELFNLRREFQGLQSQLAAASETDDDEDAIGEAEEKVAKLESQVQELRSVIEEREAAEAKLATEREKLSAQVSEFREKAVQLEEELEVTKEAAAEATTQQSPEHSLANETVRQLNQNLTQRDAEIFNLRRESQNLQSQLAAVSDTEDADDDETANNELEENVARLESQVQELEAERKRVREEFASARERLHEELAAAKEAEASAREEVETVRRQVSDQATLVEQLREERRNRQDELVTLQSKLADSNDTNVIETLKIERDDALARYDKLQIDFAHAVKDPASLDEDTGDELNSLKTKLAEKSADLDAVQAEHHTLKARFAAETEALKSRLESLQRPPVTEEAEGVSDNEEESSGVADAEAEAKIAELEAVIEQHEQYAAGLQTERQDLLDQLGASQEDINVKAAEMRRMREQLQAAQSQATTAAQQQDEFSESQSARQELSQTLEERDAGLKRLQEEQIELKQQLAHFIDAEELWTTQRVSLYSRLGLDENGEPFDDDTLNASENGESERVEALNKLLAERDEAIEKLNERFESLSAMYSSRDEVSVLHDDASDPEDALRTERDQAAASAAEASATIAKLMGELNELKSNEIDTSRLTELEEENREYRRSVAELHASVNELEELKLSRVREQESSRQKLMEATHANAELSAKLEQVKAEIEQAADVEASDPPHQEEIETLKKLAVDLKRQRDEQRKKIGELQAEIEAAPKDRKEGVKAVRDVKKLTSKVESQEKKLHDRDDRLQDLAAELSKLRVEASALRNEVAEQKAVVRALNNGEELAVPAAIRPSRKPQASKTETNGKPRATKKPVAKQPAKSAAKTVKKKAATRKATAKKPAPKKAAPKKASPKKAAPKKAAAKKVAAKKESAPQKKDANLGMVFTKRPKSIDDLKKISGVGPVLEKRLNAAGIYQFSQVQNWSKATIDYLDEELTLGGRIRREKWINQAKRLAK